MTLTATISSKNPRQKLLMGCFVGNALEWFDFGIYGYLASIIGELFNKETDSVSALIFSYGIFAAAFFMRPLGALLFGHLGDRYGRRHAFLWSLIAMALPTGIMGLLPVYEQAGSLAPALLLGCRLLQGLSIGGEFSGSVIFLAEHAPKKQKNYFSSWPDLGSAIGMLLASLMILFLQAFLSRDEMLLWGWRVPFLMSFGLAFMGFRLRKNLTETPEFLAHKTLAPRPAWPLVQLFKHFKKRFLLATAFLMVNCGGYYFLVVFIPNHNETLLYGMATLNLLIMIPAMIIGALLADRIGQIWCLALAYTGCLIIAYPLLQSTVSGRFTSQIFWQALFAICLGFSFGPRSSLMAQLFPPATRYTSMALSYNLGNAVFGGTAPLICALLIEKTKNPHAPAYYIILAAAISLLSLIFIARDRAKDIENVPNPHWTDA